MNSHEIGQMEAQRGQNWLLGQTIPVGCALEPTLVLLNHACDPTMIRWVTYVAVYLFNKEEVVCIYHG